VSNEIFIGDSDGVAIFKSNAIKNIFWDPLKAKLLSQNHYNNDMSLCRAFFVFLRFLAKTPKKI
jgi:hypothetical protein